MSSRIALVELADRRNNFDFLRIMAAAAVIVGHSYHLLGIGYPPGLLGVPIQTFGVYVFFSLSGFLIGQSLNRSSALSGYLRNRALRLFPGLGIVVVLSSFVVGPLVTSVALPDYFTNPATWGYLANLGLYPVYVLPGVFLDLPYPAAVNGSLWTLPVEFACYVILPVVFLIRGWGRVLAAAALALIVGLTALQLAAAQTTIVLYGTNAHDAASLAVFFFASAAISVVHARRPSWLRVDVALVAVVGTFVLSIFVPDAVIYALWIILPYASVAFGLQATPVLRRFGRWGDPSYGIYLWGFPIQQMIVHFIGVKPKLLNLVLVLVVTGLVGYGSWWAVERHALKLKSRPRSLVSPKTTNNLDSGSFPSIFPSPTTQPTEGT